MPSPEHAADLERVLSRAAEECEPGRGVWFGDGLPQDVRRIVAALGRSTAEAPAELAFVEVTEVSPQGRATTNADPAALGCGPLSLQVAQGSAHAYSGSDWFEHCRRSSNWPL